MQVVSLQRSVLLTNYITTLCICTDIGSGAVSMLSNRVRQLNQQAQMRVDKDAWPPDQPNFTPLLLIQYECQHTVKQAVAMAGLIQTGDIGMIESTVPLCPDTDEPLREILDTSTVTKDLREFLVPLESGNESFILIEGAPGIGKSVLLREIAYRWSRRQVLQTFQMVLLVTLRDPVFQQAKSVSDLLQPFCEGDTRAVELVSACSQHLFESGGKNIVFLFDGFDELPKQLQQSGLIVKILNRWVLPHCGVVVSSRPHASAILRRQATTRVEILGFTEREREHYIKQAFKGQPQRIEELLQYIDHHVTISSLCFVPFNMVILLYLCKQGISLPSNSNELYSYFICLTICRHLAKSGHSLPNNSSDINLDNLPEPCCRIVKQLAKLSLQSLDNNQLIFTLSEIKAACPDIGAIPGAINGFGLLHAVQHLGLYGKTTTLNFVHISIQEFLAAYYVANLSPQEEMFILHEKFWSALHTNMFAIYVSLTKGQRPSFKQFLSGRDKTNTISSRFLSNQLKCLRLYHCFYEAGDTEMCKTIEKAKVFNRNEIDLTCTRLSASDLECVTLFLTSSSRKDWVKLCLTSCYIQDHGVRLLHRTLCGSGMNIANLCLSDNGLTASSSALIYDIAIGCRVEELWIDDNHNIGANKQLYSMLFHPLSTLEVLRMWGSKLSSDQAIILFNALRKDSKLQVLDVRLNDITDKACNAIASALRGNGSLVILEISGNPITGESAKIFLQALKDNNTLELLWLPYYLEDTQTIIRCMEETVNKERVTHGCQVKIEIYFI